MKRTKKSAEEGSNWMDTYGDMVTLLMCFFVLLYSISTVDQTKWIHLVQSFNPDATDVTQIADPNNLDEGTDPVPGSVEFDINKQFEEMYADLQAMQAEFEDSVDIEISKGADYQFIRFNDSVFFDGDSSVLRPEGVVVLDAFTEIIAEAPEAIGEIQVLGHTTQAHPDLPNELMFDRVLSANRSAVVAAFIQEKNLIDPSKLVSLGFGQFRPIAPFDTEEDRTKNRRVEILISRSGTTGTFDSFYNEVYEGVATQNP